MLNFQNPHLIHRKNKILDIPSKLIRLGVFFFNDCLIPPNTYQFRVVQDGFGPIFSIDLKIPVHTRSFEIVPESCHLLIGLSLHKYLSMLLIIAGKIDVPSNLIVDYT